ncbi:MAG: SUMF1/EgtB/PvdO family nonheme iron enzyme [Opitutales bacterium]|nr:SUMF1/EgtB/PvdO family nonheme iron enzyme [Opitutales bacterium]
MFCLPRFPARAAAVPAALALLAGMFLPARAVGEWVPVDMASANWEAEAGAAVDHLAEDQVRVRTGTGSTVAAWVSLGDGLSGVGANPFDPSEVLIGTIAFDFFLPPGTVQHQTGFSAGSAAMVSRSGWLALGGQNRFQTANPFPQILVRAGDWGTDLLAPTMSGVWYNMWLVYDLAGGEFSLYARRADAGDVEPAHRGTWVFAGATANEDYAALEYFSIGAGGIEDGNFPPGGSAADALGGVYANIHTYVGAEPNLTPTPGTIQVGAPAWEVIDTFAGGAPSAAWGGDLEDMVLDFSEGYLDLRSDVQLSAFARPGQARSIYVELPETVTAEDSPPIFTVTFDLNIKGPVGETNSFGFGVVGTKADTFDEEGDLVEAGVSEITLSGYNRRGGVDHFGTFGAGAQNLVKREDAAVILPSSERDAWYQVWLVYNAAFQRVDVYVAPDGEGAPAAPTQSYDLAVDRKEFSHLVLGHDTSVYPGVKFGNIHFASGELLTLSPTAGVFVAEGGLPEDPPRILFVSENRSAESAAQSVIEREFNAAQREALRETDFAAWESYTDVTWRDIPVEFREARLAEILSDLGLAPADPADKGFTDFLEARGYDVRRSWTEVETDPDSEGVTVTHEFWGEIGEPFSATGDYRLSQEQIDRLEAADLIIMSPDLTPGNYAWGGRAGGQASTVLIEQWNGLETPVISMNAMLVQTNEFGSWGWGWSYGFSATYDTIAAFDRQSVNPQQLDRFVFPDWRPQVNQPDSPLLAGLSSVDGDRLALYRDYESFPVLPRTPRKFSNFANFQYPANARVVLELDVPSFFAEDGVEIYSRDPVLLDVDAEIRFFQPTVMPSERVGTPAERRIYLAAGFADTGFYNFSATGEQILLNIVEELAGPGVMPSLAVLAHPQDLTVAAGVEAIFSVEADGPAEMTFRWQGSFDGGGTFSNLSDGSLFTGTHTDTLTIPEATAMLDGLRVRAVISDGSASLTSDPALLSVVSSAAPTITSHPQAVSAQEGGEAVFTAVADGVPAPVLRWQLSTDGGEVFTDIAEGGAYSGVDTADLTVVPLTLDMDGHRFRAVAQNSEGSATSAAVVLTVIPVPAAPVFVTHPEDRSLREGQAAVFSVLAEGYPAPAYQWQFSFDGESYSNITDASFGGGVFAGTQTAELTVLSADAFLDGIHFRARAANSEGEAFSAGARLTVPDGLTLDEWLAAAGVPADRRGPGDRHGPLALTNLEAYGMGLSPFEATPADLLRLEGAADGSGVFLLHYRVNTRVEGVEVIVEGSTDLAVWTAAEPQEESVLWETEGVEGREAVFPAPADRLFLRLRVGDPLPEVMVLVEGGILSTTNELNGTGVDSFYIGRHEVTWGEWKAVRAWADENGYAFSDDLGGGGDGCANDHPVHSVTWYDAVKWCNAKSEMEGLTPVYTVGGEVYRTGEAVPQWNSGGDGYRLPTEAEWEFAARGGNESQGHAFSGSNNVEAVAWYYGNSVEAECDQDGSRGTHTVGLKSSNELGLYDMSGNVAEWCWDLYTHVIPPPPFGGGSSVEVPYRRVRGGSWNHGENDCEVSFRFGAYPPSTRLTIGFRLARTPSP